MLSARTGVPVRAVRTRQCAAFQSASRRAVVVRAAATTADLQKQFGIPGNVEFVDGKAGTPTVVLKHSSGSSAQVYLHGACVTSWKQASGDEVLYVRPDAVFDKSKPISGGLPHCFPQFGPGPIQQHGFARNLDWEVGSTSADLQPDERDPEVELVLTENDYTLKMWPHKFKAVYTVTLHGEQLRTDFRVINTGDAPFTFTAALHSYFEVLGVTKAKVSGLKGLTYLDKSKDPKNPESKTEERDAVTFGEGLVDSVYLNAPEHVELDVGTGAAIAIDATGWQDVVVWNPHLTMKECYESFVCVENAKTGEAVTVAPGDSWRATTNFQVVDL
ncbi:Putative apospory-associated protein C [Monoraphidium neglectum]|uniref:glucose-6-phosphate 1-epimerase n=1 Tax=Monoraphidium neglectum TaxID=145388 RepID=A0A0D2MIK0_9CHLO|nr:Putative apospory-associated protein C [Monoraphidium neglectum]KIZ00487.1 Putative apospory-associated protein C [Monoraphidium neglectum]|eukprot:XP_013899506.1 Putative apospory-associated protein C [Monoraphidium neglectum]